MENQIAKLPITLQRVVDCSNEQLVEALLSYVAHRDDYDSQLVQIVTSNKQFYEQQDEAYCTEKNRFDRDRLDFELRLKAKDDQVAEKDQKIQQLEAALQADLAEKDRRICKLESEVDEANQEIKVLVLDYNQLMSEMSFEKDQSAKLRGEVKSLQQENSKLNEQNQHAKIESKLAKEAVRKSNIKQAKLNEDLKKQKESCASLEDDLKKSKADLGRTTGELDQCKDESSSKSAKLRRLEQKLEKLQAELTKEKSKIADEAMKAKRAKFESEVADENKRLRSELGEVKLALVQMADALKSQVAEKDKKILDLDVGLQAENAKNSERDRNIGNLAIWFSI